MSGKSITALDMEKFYNDPSTFKARAQEEIRRCKRYATFVSMVALDLSHIDAVDDIESSTSFDEFISSFRKLIKSSIRETDLMSMSSGRKILILLVDTPREGAAALIERLGNILKYFMAGNVKSPLNWHLPMQEYCFPTSENDEDNFVKFLEKMSDS